LTVRQRRVLTVLIVVLLVVLGAMGWSVWTTMQAMPSVSLIPTPSPVPTSTSTPTLTPVPTVTPTPFLETGEAGKIAREVAEAREVLPRWETPLTFVDTYDLSVILYRYYQETPPFPLSARRTLEALALWPSVEVEANPVAQAENVAAMYLAEQRQFYLHRDWDDSFRKLRSQVAYGYARVLPEQYGDLARWRGEATSIDRSLALDAIATGDALMTFWRYADVEPGSPGAEALQGVLEPAILPVWRRTSPELDTLTRFPLKLGRDFALTLYENGGLSALDAVLRRPPRTTEQLLHPLEYEKHESFTALDPLVPDVDTGWALTHTETVGQALMQLTLETWASETMTTSVEGWDGDLLQVWAGPEDNRVALWQTTWDSRYEASIFGEQAQALLPRRAPGYVRQAERPEGLPPGTWWEGSDGAAFLYRYLDRVWLVWGDDASTVEDVAAILLEARNRGAD
jgi:hypothetical protein